MPGYPIRVNIIMGRYENKLEHILFSADDKKDIKEHWSIAWKNDWQPGDFDTSVKSATKNGDQETKNLRSYIDSKYSWIVMAVAFVSNFMSIGFSYAIGIYFVEFRDIFLANARTTSLVSALNFGMVCISGTIIKNI